ncbi:hypothetical protein IF188_10320 [Microbacterium sp. NEAU-LLC]|uniref:Heparinase n=1 Tax=Microbacterium helvum TaxID=2773713 RepID=A0ABR8NN68_9MICO|nr:hypothetical protein [Microbacterium helvum]MBD3942091.1 hypothetical protein [Microbacterium helvum]
MPAEAATGSDGATIGHDTARALRAEVRRRAFRQVRDAGRSDDGAWISPRLGIADPGHNGTAAFSCAAALLAACDDQPSSERAELAERATAAVRFVLRARRDSGLLDLPACNPDSAPDTGFVLQQLAATLLLLRRHGVPPELEQWERDTCALLEGTAGAMLAGGFHTPNHRWVIASAAALAAAVLPEHAEEWEPGIRAILDEGLDIDADGFFPERSVGVYDAVTDRALLFLHLLRGTPGALDAAAHNLRTDMVLLDASLRADSSLSSRQDRGSRAVPVSLIDLYQAVGTLRDDCELLSMSIALERAAGAAELHELFWRAWTDAYFGAAEGTVSDPRPSRCWTVFAGQGAARFRDGDLTATVRRAPSFVAVAHGDVGIRSVQFFQAVHGVGLFVPQSAEFGDRRALLTSAGAPGRRPGYELPLGEPVRPDGWDASLDRRDVRRLPPLEVTAEVACEPAAVDVRLTAPGMAGTLGAILIDVDAGLVADGAGLAFVLREGQELFLAGEVVLRGETHAVRVTGGATAHRAWALRDSPPLHDGYARIVIPVTGSVRHRVRIETLNMGSHL